MADKMSKLILPIKSGDTIINKEFDVGGSGNTNTFVGTTAEWEALTTEQQNAYDCRVLTDDDLDTKSVIDNLTSDSATDALSAKQGKVLKELVDSTQQIIAPIQTTLVASKAYAVDEQFVYNGLLYKATAAIAQDGTITIGGNCALVDCVTQQIKGLSTFGLAYTVVETKQYLNVTADEWYYETYASDDICIIPIIQSASSGTEEIVVAIEPQNSRVKTKSLINQTYAVCLVHIKKYT